MAADLAVAAVPVQSASRSVATTRFPARRSGHSQREPIDAQEPGLRRLRRAGWGEEAGAVACASSSFTLLAGEPAKGGIMDGVDTTWARLKDGAQIAKLADEAVSKFDLKDPAASLAGLLAIRKQLASLPSRAAEIDVSEKRQQLDRAIQGCLGLAVETIIPRAEVVPGEVLHMRHSATIASSAGIRWLSVSYPTTGQRLDQPVDLAPDGPRRAMTDQTLPAKTPLDHPYWLVDDHGVGLFTINSAGLIGRPESPAAFPIAHTDSRLATRLSRSATPPFKPPGKGNRLAHWK